MKALDAMGLASCFVWSTLSCTPLLDASSKQLVDVDGKAGSPPSQGPLVLGEPVRLTSPATDSSPTFGTATAMSGSTIAIAAAFEDGTGPALPTARGGIIYLFDVAHPKADPVELTIPNASAGDGTTALSVLPEDVPHPSSAWPTVRLAMDERSLVVGVPGEDSASQDPADDSAMESGAVYVFDRAHLDSPRYVKAPRPQAGDVFGTSVSLSKEWLAVGAPGEQDGSGAVFVYPRGADGHVSGDPAYIKAMNAGAHDWFGLSVVVGDEQLVVGAGAEDGTSTGAQPKAATADDDESSNSGAAYVYRRINGEWQHTRYLKQIVNMSGNGPGSGYGFAVAMDGDRIAVGAPGAVGCDLSEVPVSLLGATFLVDSTSWTEECVRPASGSVSTLLGWMVTSFGGAFVTTAPWDPRRFPGSAADPADLPFSGTAYLVQKDRIDYVKSPDPEHEQGFGMSVSASGDYLALGSFEVPPGASAFASITEATNGLVYIYRLAH